MATYWMGGKHYPRLALYFQCGTTGGYDRKGMYQVIVTNIPEKYKITPDDNPNGEDWENGRIFINPDILSEEENILLNPDLSDLGAGLGDFDVVPSQQEIVDRMRQIKVCCCQKIKSI